MANQKYPKPRQFGDLDSALKVRDLIAVIAEDVVNKKRPRGQQAVIVDYDRQKLKAEVLFPGDDTTVEASFPENLQPKRKKNDAEGTIGDIVHVEGRPGQYRITAIESGTTFSEGQTLSGASVMTLQGVEELLAGMLPQPGDCMYTFRTVSGGGAVLPGNWALCDNSLVTRSSPFDKAWEALGSPANGTDGTNWRLEDGRGRAPFGVDGSSVTLRGDEGSSLGNRGPAHVHAITTGGAHTHNHGHTHDITSTNHSGITNASYTETGIKNLVQQINGSHNGSHAHGGNTGQPGDPTTGSNGDHNHGGETGSGVGGSNKMGWKGVNWLIKL